MRRYGLFAVVTFLLSLAVLLGGNPVVPDRWPVPAQASVSVIERTTPYNVNWYESPGG